MLIVGNKKSCQTSIPIDVMITIWKVKADQQAAADTLAKDNDVPPSHYWGVIFVVEKKL